MIRMIPLSPAAHSRGSPLSLLAQHTQKNSSSFCRGALSVKEYAFGMVGDQAFESQV